MKREKKTTEKISKSAASGAVALIFLILGFQLAIFVMKVVERPAPSVEEDQAAGVEYAVYSSSESVPQQVDIQPETPNPVQNSGPRRSRYGGYEAPAKPYSRPPRKVESFPFDPNTVTSEDLVRLGLSERQAESILNYREKGGRFRAKEDFRKMYVVSDTLYERLEPFIDIPRLERNSADSAALVSLRCIGPWYAHKILEYRESLGGFYSVEQLLEVYGMDEERLAPLKPQVRVDASLVRPLRIWELGEEQLAAHPYVGRAAARSIARFRRVCDTSAWTLEHLVQENALDSISARRLKPYIK